MRPLDGIVVVSLEHAIAAPFCTRQLADLGARVIKIERPGVGDFARAYDERVRGMSSHFVWVNRSKQSLTLDLKQERARDVLSKLIARADVLVQNLAPGAADRLGLSAATLRPRQPRLIVCDISGYGADGPYRDKKAYDLLIQSEAGFLSVTGTPEDPAKAGCSIADIAAGMYAYTGILAALLQRQRTGEGSRIDVSMLEALTEWMSYPLYYAFEGASAPERSGAAHATIYPYGPFEAGDGKTVMLGLQNEREWAAFCADVLRQPALATDPRFAANGAARAYSRRVPDLDRGRGCCPPRWSADRQCARQHDGRRMGASSARGAQALDRGRDTGRRSPGAAAAGHERRVRVPHGRNSRAWRAYRGDSARAGVR